MVHADAATIPDGVKSKAEFYDHLHAQLSSLLDGQRNWVTNLSNASSIIYASLNRFQQRLAKSQQGYQAKTVNWAGFYLLSPLFPTSDAPASSVSSTTKPLLRPTLWLGPFCGLPACQKINSVPGRGVCADASALLPPRAVRVDRTDDYPGHIACDSASQSEIVIPLVISRSSHLSRQHVDALSSVEVPIEWQGRGNDDEVIIGVLDIDCEQVEGFDKDDEDGLTRITKLIATSCDW
ncbi:hypothetical protein K437DRAFT_253925 [Tilletiaria anomala UBC 951]|uniref:GAF domain-like protein n=1 Tax=Tilletiaria anomala (strain ATCC 24038 / CBS 436.72 / UBC 951) TaxID=1037660 RepID=A0A066WQ29_TILAU|nr:uncharacterized protein K437DRAFT_253925 [Tilletiaria anomala UBC 951]KDN52730.1 hypothetical protein K437DRAFT_253925 [Tilletiaria anomala UBC 951]